MQWLKCSLGEWILPPTYCPLEKHRNSRFYPELYPSPEAVLVYTNYKSQGQRYLDPISIPKNMLQTWTFGESRTPKWENSHVKDRSSDCRKASTSPSRRTLKAPTWFLSSTEAHFSRQLHSRGRFTGTETWLKSVIKEIDSKRGKKKKASCLQYLFSTD